MNARRKISSPNGMPTDHVEQHTLVCPDCGAARMGPAVPIRAHGATMVWVCHACEKAWEVGHWFAPVSREQPPSLEQLRQANEQLKADAKRLQRWVTDMQQGLYVNCVYCGHRYGPAETTPTSMHEMLTTHIENCVHHPLFHARAEVAELRTVNLYLVPDGNSPSLTVCCSLEAAVQLAKERGINYVRQAHEFPRPWVRADEPREVSES